MFERYTEKARRVIFFARYEASLCGGMSITTEHLLLGLLREDQNILSRFIHDTSLDNLRAEIEARIDMHEKVPASIDLPLSEANKRILAYADEESRRLQTGHVGTEHLLLGILREEKCGAAEILRGHGVGLEAVRDALT